MFKLFCINKTHTLPNTKALQNRHITHYAFLPLKKKGRFIIRERNPRGKLATIHTSLLLRMDSYWSCSGIALKPRQTTIHKQYTTKAYTYA